jgi:hypothetical protein
MEGKSGFALRPPPRRNVAHCVAHDHALELSLRFTKAEAWGQLALSGLNQRARFVVPINALGYNHFVLSAA